MPQARIWAKKDRLGTIAGLALRFQREFCKLRHSDTQGMPEIGPARTSKVAAVAWGGLSPQEIASNEKGAGRAHSVNAPAGGPIRPTGPANPRSSDRED